MASRFAVPTPDEIIGPGIDALVALRPQTLRHLNNPNSVYRRAFEGWRAQAASVIAYLADEVASTRLRVTRGRSLVELAADEYETVVDPSATPAYGTATLTRATGSYPAGILKKGFRFRRDAVENATPVTKTASYVSTKDVVVASGATSASVPYVADRAGAHANAPIMQLGSPLGTLKAVDALFDTAFTVSAFTAAGGSDGIDDDTIVREAEAYALGQYAPNLGAIVAGARRGTGVRRLDVRDIAQVVATLTPRTYTNAAFTNVVLADASWATSPEWQSRVQQQIHDDFLGIGEVVRMGSVSNVVVRVDLTVTLRDGRDLANTDEIDAAIAKVLGAYFDDRPDWWTWKRAQIRATVARADRRILTCTIATVRTMSTGSPLAEPPAPLPIISGNSGITLVHYMLPPGAITTTYLTPS